MGYAAENTNLTRLAIVVPTKQLLKVVEAARLNLEVVIEKVFTACLIQIREVPRGGTPVRTHFHLSRRIPGFNGGSGLDGEYLVQAALTYRPGILKMVLPCFTRFSFASTVASKLKS